MIWESIPPKQYLSIFQIVGFLRNPCVCVCVCVVLGLGVQGYSMGHASWMTEASLLGFSSSLD